MEFTEYLLLKLLHLTAVLTLVINFSSGRRFDEEPYYPPQEFYDSEVHYSKFKLALGKLEHAPQWVNNWPDPEVKLGQVSGLALNAAGHLLVFHRASNTWDSTTFNRHNVYQQIGSKPIPEPTILVFNETGGLIDMWGQNLFHMPHGIAVDAAQNVWVTDVALHQVFKFSPADRRRPALVLGEKFVPGDDEARFCKPSAVAVLGSGEFFVADGYCNARVIKFDAQGNRVLQWGRRYGDSPFVFNVPHALTLAEDRGLVCVADRERGRVACFRSDNGTYVSGFSNWLLGGRVFSVAYAPVKGGRLYVVNGPMGGAPVRGYVVELASGRLRGTFAPPGRMRSPHDVVAAPDGSRVYVAELDPHRVLKFAEDSLVEEADSPDITLTVGFKNDTPVHAKPTATVEVALAAPGGWGGRGAWGGAGAAAGGAALLLAALALLAARARAALGGGRKSPGRRRWEYGEGQFQFRRLVARRRFSRVRSDDSDDEPAPMLPPADPATA